jgi:ABC-type Mn2+/Zn2+ transport system ATPase subunit
MPDRIKPPDEITSANSRLDISHVTVAYNGLPALEDLTFQVPQGGQVAVVGPNGAGKSTLFKALVGLIPVRSGEIFIHDLPLGAHQTCVAYVPQREEVDWRFPLTVTDVVMMGRYGHTGWLRGVSRRDQQVTARCLEQMGIAHLADRSIGDLSGGQQQRAFLARALAQEPHILLMDEPFTGVDAPTQEATLELLHQLRAQQVSVLVSTHDLNMAAQRFDQVLLLNRRLIAYGPPEQVFSPENIRAAFSKQALVIDGLMVVDECCPGDTEHRTSEHHPGESFPEAKP